MSYHILHILSHGMILQRDHGHLVCRPGKKDDERPPRRMALEDIRAVVIAGRGVTLTSSAVSGILENEGIILHCDASYQPIGVTTPLPRTIDPRVLLNQARQPRPLNNRLWNALLKSKTRNQRAVLAERKLFSDYLERALKAPKVNEGTCAKQYWQLFFPAIGYTGTSRDRKLDNPPNRMLNYGYTVLAALCHRAIVVHGLSPQLGVGHKPKYRGDPLVYDLMEPYRPFVDRMLASFLTQREIGPDQWCKTVGRDLVDTRVLRKKKRIKLLDAIDMSARSLAQCYGSLSSKPLWLPLLPDEDQAA